MDQEIRKIRVIRQGETYTFPCRPEESIRETMQREGMYCQAPCGGRGTCGKCRIRQIEGKLEITQQDRKVLKEEELESGLRLACQAYPREDITVELLAFEEKGMLAATEYQGKDTGKGYSKEDNRRVYGIAIDLGTTTIAIALVDMIKGNVIRTVTAINRQRAYGADVISRMKASNDGKRKELKEVILREIESEMIRLLKEAVIKRESVNQISISGNTTMIHLLMGYSCKTLGVYPFTPANIQTIRTTYGELFGGEDILPVTILPGISAFVGGDIVSGIHVCGMAEMGEICLLVDLGTNGEMVLGNKQNMLAASTAAGPAFEGGNISCGMGSVPGAISRVSLEDGVLQWETIGGGEPIGICGTGIISLISELLRNHIIDETGLLSEEYFETGYPVSGFYLMQKDIREFQMAKAAIRSGIEILMIRYGVTCEQISGVYLAGGFGYWMEIDKALSVGLLPEEFQGKITAIGNSSLAGAAAVLLEEDAVGCMEHMITRIKEIQLSNDDNFMDR